MLVIQNEIWLVWLKEGNRKFLTRTDLSVWFDQLKSKLPTMPTTQHTHQISSNNKYKSKCLSSCFVFWISFWFHVIWWLLKIIQQLTAIIICNLYWDFEIQFNVEYENWLQRQHTHIYRADHWARARTRKWILFVNWNRYWFCFCVCEPGTYFEY